MSGLCQIGVGSLRDVPQLDSGSSIVQPIRANVEAVVLAAAVVVTAQSMRNRFTFSRTSLRWPRAVVPIHLVLEGYGKLLMPGLSRSGSNVHPSSDVRWFRLLIWRAA